MTHTFELIPVYHHYIYNLQVTLSQRKQQNECNASEDAPVAVSARAWARERREILCLQGLSLAGLILLQHTRLGRLCRANVHECITLGVAPFVLGCFRALHLLI